MDRGFEKFQPAGRFAGTVDTVRLSEALVSMCLRSL